MTALLTADEAARLVPGERLVIVRAGDAWVRTDRALWPGSNLPDVDVVAPQDWVALTGPCPTCGGSGVGWTHGELCPADGCVYGACPDCRDGRRIVPLYTECPSCRGCGIVWQGTPPDGFALNCPTCQNEEYTVLVGRGSIEVVPVYEMASVRSYPCITVNSFAHEPDALFERTPDDHGQFDSLHIDPLPVPGRDFGIVIDCVEVAT